MNLIYKSLLVVYIIINAYLNLKIYIFLIKDYNIKIFSLSISIKIITLYFLFSVIILFLNNRERDYYLINSVFNIIAISIKLYLFSYLIYNYIFYYL